MFPFLAALMAMNKAYTDTTAAESDRSLASQTQRYSPWTGLQAQPTRKANAVQSGLQGFSSGMAFGKGIDSLSSGGSDDMGGSGSSGSWGTANDYNRSPAGDAMFGENFRDRLAAHDKLNKWSLW